MLGDFNDRKRLGDRIIDSVSERLLGGANLNISANIGAMSANSQSGDVGTFPTTQTRTGDIIAICGISACGDVTRCGP